MTGSSEDGGAAGTALPLTASVSPEPEAVTAAVLAWGVPRLRDLPWRRTRDPWAVLVSEVMLQQTQVPRVIPRWFAFLDAFPTPAACASVPLGDVLRLWHGLGYPRRARNLHAASQRVVELGAFPATLDDLLALPGVGPYTARAVLAFAFERDVAVVDTNIARVLARVHGRRLTPRVVQSLADELVPARRRLGVEPVADGSRRRALSAGGAGVRGLPARARCARTAATATTRRSARPGSASAKPPYAGSDRQARGRLLAALVGGPVPVAAAPALMDRGPQAAESLVAALVAEGLVARTAEHPPPPIAPDSRSGGRASCSWAQDVQPQRSVRAHLHVSRPQDRRLASRGRRRDA